MRHCGNWLSSALIGEGFDIKADNIRKLKNAAILEEPRPFFQSQYPESKRAGLLSARHTGSIAVIRYQLLRFTAKTSGGFGIFRM
jgi:hypothetical protein